MAQNIGHMRVLLSAATGQFDKAMAKSGKTVDGFASNVGRSVGSSIRSIVKWGAALAPVVAGGGMAILLKKSFQTIDIMAKMSDQINASTEGLGKLAYAGDLAGVEFEALSMGMQKMVNSISEATKGEGAGVKALRQLGLEAGKLNRMKSDEQFLAIADAISKVENRSDQLRMTLDIFGRAGAPLLHLLREGSTGLNEMGDEAEKLGLIFSRIDGRQVEEANDALTRMRAVFTGIFNIMAIRIAPIIEGGAKKFVDWATSGEGVAAKMNKIADSIENGIAKALDVAEGMFRSFVSTVAEGVAHLSALIGKVLLDWGRTSLIKKIGGDEMANDLKAASMAMNNFAVDAIKVSEKYNKKLMPWETAGSRFKRQIVESRQNAIAGIAALGEGKGDPLPDLEKFEAMMQEADKIFEDTRTPMENMATEMERLNKLFDAGALDATTYARAVDKLRKGVLDEVKAEKSLDRGEFEQVKFARTAFSLAPRGMSGVVPSGVTRAAQTQTVRDPQLQETNTILRMIASSSRFPVAVAG